MARPRRTLGPEDAYSIKNYLMDAHRDATRWHKLLESPSHTSDFHRSQSAWDELMSVPTVSYCRLTSKELPEKYRATRCPDPDELNAWVERWLSKDGRGRMLNAIRQKRHATSHNTRSTKLSAGTHRILARTAQRLGLTIDDTVLRLVKAAEANPDLLEG